MHVQACSVWQHAWLHMYTAGGSEVADLGNGGPRKGNMRFPHGLAVCGVGSTVGLPVKRSLAQNDWPHKHRFPHLCPDHMHVHDLLAYTPLLMSWCDG